MGIDLSILELERAQGCRAGVPMERAPCYINRPMRRKDKIEIGFLIILALAVELGIALYAVGEAKVPLESLAVYFDGHLYLEIARSFPVPYSPAGPDYLGHSPGYPGLAWFLHVLLPNRLVDWGGALLLAAWIPAALAPGVFYLLCRELQISAFWPSFLFIAGNPRWLTLSATPHPEPLAVLLVIAILLAYQRQRLAWCMFLLSLAVLTRYPAILIGLPIAFGTILIRRDWSPKTIAILASPLAVFGAFNAYLFLRIPDFAGISAAHRVFWITGPTWPFAALWGNAERWLWPPDYPLFEVTYASLLFYLVMIPVGFRPSERRAWLLPVWVATIVLFHVSLSGILGAWDFARLVVLAWPAALLIFWKALGTRLPGPAVGALCVLALLFSAWFANAQIRNVLAFQMESQPILKEKARTLSSDEPSWTDFRALTRPAGPPQPQRGKKSPASKRRPD
jgi:hypothetical protein